MDTSSFIKKHKKKSIFEWDYSKTIYNGYLSPITLTCPVHGPVEVKTAEYALKGTGCKKCIVSNLKKKNLNYFISKAKKYHGDLYDYSMIKEDAKARDIVKIICPTHGTFEQRLSAHCSGQGCPKCKNDRTKISKFEIQKRISSTTPFVSLVFNSYISVTDLAQFECSKHGSFTGKVNSILNNTLICPFCGYELTAEKISKDRNLYIAEANIVHNFKYDYSNFYPLTSKDLGPVKCPIHGDFQTSWNYHIHNKSGCPKCGGQLSVNEDEIFNYIKSLLPDNEVVIGRSKPNFLNGKELDIYVPNKNFAIEYNGSYWHSEQYREKWYHFDKWKNCKMNNITLLNIWDFYWKDPAKNKIYKSKIKHLLGLDTKIYARKCKLSKIDNLEAKNFYLENHLDGCGILYSQSSSVALYQDELLLMVATYGKFYSQSENTFKWKLQRICTKQGYTVVGGVSKISKYIRNDVGDFQFQITLDTGGILSDVNPERKNVSLRYWWVNNKLEYKSRNQCQVSILKLKSDWLENDTEKSYMERNKFYRVWDSGILNLGGLN